MLKVAKGAWSTNEQTKWLVLRNRNLSISSLQGKPGRRSWSNQKSCWHTYSLGAEDQVLQSSHGNKGKHKERIKGFHFCFNSSRVRETAH